MANGQWSRSVDLGTRGTDRQVLGVGDFNNDHTSDIPIPGLPTRSSRHKSRAHHNRVDTNTVRGNTMHSDISDDAHISGIDGLSRSSDIRNCWGN